METSLDPCPTVSPQHGKKKSENGSTKTDEKQGVGGNGSKRVKNQRDRIATFILGILLFVRVLSPLRVNHL